MFEGRRTRPRCSGQARLLANAHIGEVLRELDDADIVRTDAATVLPQVLAHGAALLRLVNVARGILRLRLMLLAAHGAEFAGWMCRERGDLIGARHYTNQATSLCTDTDLARYLRVRLAEISLTEGGSAAARELAEATGSAGVCGAGRHEPCV
jgi:hypothetical protein